MSILDSIKRRARPWICPFEPIVDTIPTGSAVFDIGCGSGFLLGLIAEKKAPLFLGGTEINPKLVREGRKYLDTKAPRLPVSISLYDGIHLPEEIVKADVVLLIDVLHHIPSAAQFSFLQSIYARMRRSATFILKDIDASRRFLCLGNKLHDLVASGKPGHEMPKEEARRILESLAFQVESAGAMRKLWYPHYWFVAVKV